MHHGEDIYLAVHLQRVGEANSADVIDIKAHVGVDDNTLRNSRCEAADANERAYNGEQHVCAFYFRNQAES